MKIEVTQVHIDNGIVGNGFSCPIALALIDQVLLEANSYWYIFEGQIQILRGKLRKQGRKRKAYFVMEKDSREVIVDDLSTEANRFIRFYDCDQFGIGHVQPFEFEMEYGH